MDNNPILRIATKILFAPIILFGLYVQFHGDFGPGGGFQAGVIVASAFILYAIVFGLEKGKELFPLSINLFLLALGGILYGGVGIASMMLGDEFLSYNVLGSSQQAGQHIGILLVEFGVGLTVSNVMIALFYAFASFESSNGEKK
ncbi:MAG: Na(+)/H(+) antiporter subunit B [Candidatus Puniceispirillales bacterium]|jgi:multicomponent Na+:H+ antiporter subunit B|nr:Na(+)/H(+) antiporter subunit B [Alphaproteobacteria bacterium]MBL6851012.1 Na(+)/H(+) antiporter subunit B [Alphaproteobacteria bacterium]